MPQPAVRRYCAIVVVKPPEFEKIATEPCSSVSSGMVAAERAADAHAAPRVGDAEAVAADDVDAVAPCAIARISRASCTAIFSVTMTIFFRSGLTRISSATPSRTPDGGR